MFGLKIGQKVKVLTTEHFRDQIGTITTRSRETVTVKFGDSIGIYTIEKNEFEVIND